MFKHILVAVDDTDQAAAALDLAIGLGKQLSSALTILHVLDPAKVTTPVDITAVSTVEIEVEELEAAGKSVLEAAVSKAKGSGLIVNGILKDGIPAQTINDVATTENCDLIVVGTHGREGISRFFLGSTAENVARESTIPVLFKRV